MLYGAQLRVFGKDALIIRDHLKRLGVALVPTSAPDHFTEDTPTSALFDKATLVAELKAARDRKRARTGKCDGRRSHIEARPEVVALA
jgi:hypothetical protein